MDSITLNNQKYNIAKITSSDGSFTFNFILDGTTTTAFSSSTKLTASQVVSNGITLSSSNVGGSGLPNTGVGDLIIVPIAITIIFIVIIFFKLIKKKYRTVE
ncbi:MAG: hypothetical protein WCJ19_03260 [bacterium]